MKSFFQPLFLLITLLILVIACQPTETTDELESVSIDSLDIQKVITTLGGDDYEGRKPFTNGEVKTINYLRDQFVEIGLEPGNGDSYFQEVPLVEITGIPAATMQVKGKDGSNFDLKISEDYVAFTERTQEEVKLEDSELVFCGYGIVAPEYNWNDYEGIDMKGKTAVVMVNDPGFDSKDSTLFKGKTMTYYGRWTYKYEEAARQGAAGVLIIHETNAAGYPWFVVKSSWSGAALHLKSPDGNQSKCAIQGWVTLTVASKLFKASGDKEGRFFERAKSPDFKPIPLGVTVSTSVKNEFRENTSQNVVGMIKGSERPEEYIIYTAHWDHLGIGPAVNGDSIYNGALDNATGTAGMLAIARAFKKMKTTPKRSVVFLAVTAEEQGLLGSAYYAANPIFPVNNTVANLNIDGMLPFGKMKDLTITGIGQSDLDDYAAEEAKKQGRYILPDQEPEKGFFFRSDHFSFAKIGIPALYASGGYDHMTKGKAYAASKIEEFTTANYHRPSDEYDADTWELGGMVQDAQFYLNIGVKLANESSFPEWKDGSEFKGIRKRELKD